MRGPWMACVVGCWLPMVSIAAPWKVAPLTPGEPAAFISVDDVMRSPTFGVVVLSPEGPESRDFVSRWYSDEDLQVRYPLLLVYEGTGIGNLTAPTFTFHALPDGQFDEYVKGFPTLLTCSTLDCVPAEVSEVSPLRRASRKTERVIWSEFVVGHDVMSGPLPIDEFRDAVRSPSVAEIVRRDLPRPAREALAAANGADDLEQLAIVLYELVHHGNRNDPSIRYGSDWRAQFDLGCAVRDARTCAR